MRRRAAALLALGLLALAPAAPGDDLHRLYQGPPSSWPRPQLAPGAAFAEFAPLPPPAATDERARIGARLFADPRLSARGDMTCATCHDPARDFAGPAAEPVPGRRDPPSLTVAALRRTWGWDGRGGSLAAMALRPLTRADEMANADLAAVIGRLAGDPTLPGLTPDDLGADLAAYLATLPRPTRFDRFLAGESEQLSDQEIRGLHLFRTKAGCANCHSGPLLSDEKFHNLKLSNFGEPAEDLGRYAISGDLADAGAFRTASLRHVGTTAPYMHNGAFGSLEGVINLYDRGGGEVWARHADEAARPLYPFAAKIAPEIRPLGLTADEKADLAAFLRCL